MRSDLKKLDSFTLELSKNHLIRTFLRNGRLRVKATAVFLYFSIIKAFMSAGPEHKAAKVALEVDVPKVETFVLNL